VGFAAIQLAKVIGCRVIATCSARNFDLLRSAGADEVFDYGDAGVVDDIRKATNNNLRYAFDTVGRVSQPICLPGDAGWRRLSKTRALATKKQRATPTSTSH
jgi:NADPH-dependent curcumin reductase CurA